MPPKIKQKGSIGANAMVGDHGAVKETPMYDADEEKDFGFPSGEGEVTEEKTSQKKTLRSKKSAVDDKSFTEPEWLQKSKKDGEDMSLYRSAEEAKADQKGA